MHRWEKNIEKIFQKQGGRIWIRFNWAGHSPVVSSYKHGKKCLGLTKYGRILNLLGHY